MTNKKPLRREVGGTVILFPASILKFCVKTGKGNKNFKAFIRLQKEKVQMYFFKCDKIISFICLGTIFKLKVNLSLAKFSTI